MKREGGSQEYYSRGSGAEGNGDMEGARRRRLTAKDYKLAANQLQQNARETQGQEQEVTGKESTATAGVGAAEIRTAAAPAGKIDSTVSRTVEGAHVSEAALEGATWPESRVEVVQMDIIAGEGQGVGSDGSVDAVEGGGVEGDKGIKEGEASGFVVEVQDSKVRRERVGYVLLLPMKSSRLIRALARRTAVFKLVPCRAVN